MEIQKIAKDAGTFVSKHSPEILTGIGIGGFFFTVVLAVKETPKVYSLIEERKEELETEKLPAGEILKISWKYYIPAATSALISTACLIGASSVSFRRNVALTAAYKISETAYNEYRRAVDETVTDEQKADIRERVKRRTAYSENEEASVIQIKDGKCLCYEPYSKEFFYSNWNTIERAVNEVNKEMLCDINSYASLNDLCDALDIHHHIIGGDIGWNANMNGIIEIYPGSGVNNAGEPYLKICYSNPPTHDYDVV